jgi:hypothetical protein
MMLRAKPHHQRPVPLPATFTPSAEMGVKVFLCLVPSGEVTV